MGIRGIPVRLFSQTTETTLCIGTLIIGPGAVVTVDPLATLAVQQNIYVFGIPSGKI